MTATALVYGIILFNSVGAFVFWTLAYQGYRRDTAVAPTPAVVAEGGLRKAA